MASQSVKETLVGLEETSMQRSQRQSEMSQAYYAQHTGDITGRLKELELEWTVDKVLKTAGSVATGYGLLSGLIGRRRGVLLGLVAQSFAIQQAVTGTSLPAILLHRVGLRTQKELEEEKAALSGLKKTKAK
ncbi:MAG TPA: hypothetical protein VF624_05005 [Tepidisphaeraceae bacterium]|jgi:hypothetical protein